MRVYFSYLRHKVLRLLLAGASVYFVPRNRDILVGLLSAQNFRSLFIPVIGLRRIRFYEGLVFELGGQRFYLVDVYPLRFEPDAPSVVVLPLEEIPRGSYVVARDTREAMELEKKGYKTIRLKQ